MGEHFSEAGLRFLRGLKRNNDRDWFNERKAVYERELKAPMLSVIEAVNEEMLRFAPDHVRPAAKSMMRIYRDIRFSKDKRPYKVHASAWWARAGLNKTSGGGFYLQVAADEVLIAAGAFMPEREQLLAIRRHLVVHHARLRKELQSHRLAALGLVPMSGDPLTRLPKGFDESPAEAVDLLLCRKWGVSVKFPAAMALTDGFAHEVARRFEKAAALVALLNEPLADRSRKNSFSPLPLR